jgi:FkbM family methyltransferase
LDSNFFIVDISKGTKLAVRRNIVGDVVVVAETIIQDEYRILSPYLKDAIALDIGAYIGDSSIKFVLEGAKEVHSYEPHPDLFSLAYKNIELNNLNSKIVLKNFGVSDREVNLVIKEDSCFGASSVFGLTNYQRAKGVMLKLLPLNSIILQIGHIDVMKMDCEGAEFAAILSCPQETLRKIKVMLIEYHDDPASLVSYLEQAGFIVKKKKEYILANRMAGLLFAQLKKAD